LCLTRSVGLRLLSRQIWSAGNFFALQFHRDLSKLGREFEWRQTTEIHRWPCPRAPDLVIDMGAIAGKNFQQARIEGASGCL
jgi:hypothetical protein